MNLLIWFLTAILFLDAVFLVAIILVQLPKKEAGAGVAFGGGAADALFGAGAGSELTKITKYAAGLFLVLALVLTVLNNWKLDASRTGINEALEKETAGTVATPEPAQDEVKPADETAEAAPSDEGDEAETAEGQSQGASSSTEESASDESPSNP